MPFNLLLNSSNVINTDNTNFEYVFANGSFTIEEGSEICVSQIVMPYSFFNLNKGLYNNTTFSFSLRFGATTTQYDITIPDGFYTTTDINNYLEQYFITNAMYCTDTATGNNVYFIYLYSNATYYANQFIVSPIIPLNTAGYTFPTSYINSSTSVYGYTPYIIFNTGGLGSILGFNNGTYPTTQSLTTQLNFISNTTPNATPINSIVIRTNLCNNDCASPSDILDTFSLTNSTFGANITYTPSYEKWINCSYGTFNSFFVYFQDQNLNRIQSNDPNVLISLLLRQGTTARERALVRYEDKLLMKEKTNITPIDFKDEHPPNFLST
jgi:hypothetical protein